MTQGATPRPHTHGRRGLPSGGAQWVLAHLGPSRLPPQSHLLSLSRKTPENLLKLKFLLFLLAIFDLLVQPISCADFWRDCSLVCASSTCPIRFVIGRLYLEYFATIGDRLFELACLFYAQKLYFDACVALQQVPIVVAHHLSTWKSLGLMFV